MFSNLKLENNRTTHQCVGGSPVFTKREITANSTLRIDWFKLAFTLIPQRRIIVENAWTKKYSKLLCDCLSSKLNRHPKNPTIFASMPIQTPTNESLEIAKIIPNTSINNLGNINRFNSINVAAGEGRRL